MFNTTANGDGSYTAISSLGTITGAPDGVSDLDSLVLDTLPPPGVEYGDGISFDNQLYIGQDPLVNDNGLLWTSDGVYVNLYNIGGTYYYLDSVMYEAGDLPGIAVSFTVASVPEPSTMISGATACLAGLYIARRRRRKTAAA